MTGLAFVCGIAVLFVSLFFGEALAGKQEISLRPAGLLRWAVSGNWPAKVGATLLLISTGALLRYLILTIDFPATGKLGVGILAVSILAGLSISFHDNVKRRAIHLALGGAALGVAYLTAYSAYSFFNFISSIQALGMLFIVACAATAFALESRAQSIAILAMAGAFIAPAFALESPGVVPVYGYYVLASSLVLLMVALRGWRPLIHLSFLFTLAGALFFGWTQKFYEPTYFSQLHPLLLALVGIHLLMPLFELRDASAHDAQGVWLRRFDNSYFLLLPLVSAFLMILLAPNDAVDGAFGLLELGLLWGFSAGIQHWRFRAGIGRYAAVALTMAVVAALLAFRNIPYFLVAASASCLLLAGSRALRLTDGWMTALAMVALTSSAFYVMQSLVAPAVSPPFLNGAYFGNVILAVSLLLAAFGSRSYQNRAFTSVYLVSSVAWIVIASVRELIILDLVFLPQLAYLAALTASIAYAAWIVRRPPNMAITFLLASSLYFSGLFCARLLPTALLIGAALTGQFAFLAVAHVAGRHIKSDGEAIAGISRSLLPVLIFPFASSLSSGIDAPHTSVVMCFLVSSALVASMHAQVTMSTDRFWPNSLSPVGFVIFSLRLFYQTAFHIERNAWAISYEVIALLYIVQTVLSLLRSRSRDANFFSMMAILALVTTSAAMFLRAFGPPGTLTLLAMNRLLLPAVVSLFWAIVGALMTWWAMRIQSRRLWVLGSLLLVVSAVKLVLFDFGSLGQLGNILAMMAAGGVFMTVAWLAPFPPKKEVPEEKADDVHESIRTQEKVATPQQRPVTTVDSRNDASGHQAFRSRSPAGRGIEANNESTGSSRTWLWILVGLAVIIFFHHVGERRHVKAVVSPTVQSKIGDTETGLQAAQPPTALEPQNDAAQHTVDVRESVCSRFKSQLPEDFEIYAAGGYARVASRRNTELNPGLIDVYINRPGKKVLLVLGADESVTWNIKDSGSTKIIGVVLSGRSLGVLNGLPAQVPVLKSAYENGAPCGYFVGEPDAMQSVYPFVSQLLTRAVDEIAVPQQGRVDFGVGQGKPIVTASLKRPIAAPHGIHCNVPDWNNPATSCSGQVLATGSMNNSDDPVDAARNCEKAKVAGTCCMYHLYGVGTWYLTDGMPQPQGRLCEIEPSGTRNSCYAGGRCTVN